MFRVKLKSFREKPYALDCIYYTTCYPATAARNVVFSLERPRIDTVRKSHLK